MNDIREKDQDKGCFTDRYCCGSEKAENSKSLVDDRKCTCISACRWFALIPVVLVFWLLLRAIF